MSHFYAAITDSARKTQATARGHRSTGIAGWAGSYDGIVTYEIHERDGVDFVRVELRQHKDRGGQLVQVIYDGPVNPNPETAAAA